jgi:arsenate reductase
MIDIKIYHYPKCSTSSTALAFLRSQNMEPEIILYCEIGLQKTEILKLMDLLAISKPLDLIKRNGITYRNLGLAHKSLSDEELIDVIIHNPKLIQRPIIIYNNKAIIGRNTEIIQNFLSQFRQYFSDMKVQ